MNAVITSIFKWMILSILTIGGICLVSLLLYSLYKDLKRFFRFTKKNKVVILFLPLLYALVLQGSTKPTPPPPIETEEGIRLTEVNAQRDSVSFKWESTDERIKKGAIFQIQRRYKAFPFLSGWSNWSTVKEVSANEATIKGFTWDKNNQYRIAVLIETDDTEGGNE